MTITSSFIFLLSKELLLSIVLILLMFLSVMEDHSSAGNECARVS